MKTIYFYRVSVKKEVINIFQSRPRFSQHTKKVRHETGPFLICFFYNNLVFKRLAKLSSSSKELY